MIKCRVLSGEEETLSFKPNLLKSERVSVSVHRRVG